MSQGIFLTGTDTEVGKTVVSAALLVALRARGLDAGYIKPVGTDGLAEAGRLVSPDLAFVRQVSGLEIPAALGSPLCLRNPLSPLAAARLEGVELRLEEILGSIRAGLAQHRFTVVEGVGGIMGPLTERHLVLDLMADLGLPVVVAARPGLGTINHTLLTIGAARARGLAVAGFIFSGPDPSLPPDPAIAQNSRLITEFSGAPFLGSLAWLPRDAEGGIDGGQLLAAAQALDLEPLLALAGAD